jgi:hypothetical protein
VYVIKDCPLSRALERIAACGESFLVPGGSCVVQVCLVPPGEDLSEFASWFPAVIDLTYSGGFLLEEIHAGLANRTLAEFPRVGFSSRTLFAYGGSIWIKSNIPDCDPLKVALSNGFECFQTLQHIHLNWRLPMLGCGALTDAGLKLEVDYGRHVFSLRSVNGDCPEGSSELASATVPNCLRGRKINLRQRFRLRFIAQVCTSENRVGLTQNQLLTQVKALAATLIQKPEHSSQGEIEALSQIAREPYQTIHAELRVLGKIWGIPLFQKREGKPKNHTYLTEEAYTRLKALWNDFNS